MRSVVWGSGLTRTVFLNGSYVAEEAAKVSIFDRGFQFADAVYEVTTVIAGELVDHDAHLARLRRSLAALAIPSPADDADIVAIERELIARNNLLEGVVYLQISRGVAERSFSLPDTQPTFVVYTQAFPVIARPEAARGLAVISVPDLRWARRDIKTVALLAASLAKQAALDAGADDAWMVEDGYVTEGTSNNAWIVNGDGALQTRRLGSEILPGVTRVTVMGIAREAGYVVEEKPFTLEEARDAREAFVTSASMLVMPVVVIDGQPVGDGRPGPVTRDLRARYVAALCP